MVEKMQKRKGIEVQVSVVNFLLEKLFHPSAQWKKENQQMESKCYKMMASAVLWCKN